MKCTLSDQKVNQFRALLLMGSALLSAPAWAQTAQTSAGATSGDLSEVVVTAQRVSEPLQKTPASISVLSADNLETAGVQNFSDVAHLVPSLTFTDGYRSGVPQISMRGIPTVQGGEAPVAFVIDGAQVPGLDFVNQDLLDIADIQVLRGPQGGIYGRNAIGGAIVIDTQRPTDKFEDTLTLDAGNGGYFRALNTASGPVIPGKLWVKATLEAHHFDGLLENAYQGRPADFVKDYAGRLELVAKPTTTTTIDLSYAHTEGIEGASYISTLRNYTVGDFSEAHEPSYNTPIVDHRYLDSYVAKIDQETPIGTFTSVSQYAETRSLVQGDADWTTAPVVDQWNKVGVRAVNEDFHLSSQADQTVQWIAGGFYQLRQTVNNLNVYFEPVPGGINPICRCAGGPTASVLLDDDHNNSLAWAVYGQATAHLPANLKLDVAVRYDSDRRTDQDLSVAAGPNNAISHTFGAFQPSGTLSEQFTPDLMSYVTVGKGFRSGGFNAYTDSVAAGLLVQREYPAETDINYEAGIKSQFLNHHLTVNADVYHTEFNNEQYYLVNITPPARDVVTIKSVTYNGGELEVSYLPVDGLTLSASGGLADSNITSNDLDQNDHDKRSPEASLYTANLSAVYRQPLWGGDYDALYRVDYSYKGPICYDSANVYCYHPVGFLNARIGVENERYTFALWAKNIFSAREPVNFSPNSSGPGSSHEMANLPATYGVELIAHF